MEEKWDGNIQTSKGYQTKLLDKKQKMINTCILKFKKEISK